MDTKIILSTTWIVVSMVFNGVTIWYAWNWA